MNKVICATEISIIINGKLGWIQGCAHQKSRHIFLRFTKYQRKQDPSKEFTRNEEIIKIPSEFDTFIC